MFEKQQQAIVSERGQCHDNESLIDQALARLLYPRDCPGKNTEVGYHALLQRIFLTQGSNLCLCISRQTLYH